jgi:hypothetical protein
MEMIRTFKQPEKLSAEQWRFTLNAWMAISIVGTGLSGVVAIGVAVLVWSLVPRAIRELGWTTALIVAAVPLGGFAFSGIWLWLFLSSQRTSRRFPPTGRQATSEW